MSRGVQDASDVYLAPVQEDNVRTVLAGHDPEVADLLIYGFSGGDEGSEDVKVEDIDYDNE